ncbi:hypothetical protein [Rhodococcus sp. JVH1]|uniref:hypothetical protein n=1 Tax=Rhodococcus sp. JVH1 TaxID=745408 RepID=UPI0012F6C20C
MTLLVAVRVGTPAAELAGFHVFRNVAILVHREATLAEAAGLLGHSTSGMTEWHYAERAVDAPDLTLLEQFAEQVSTATPTIPRRTTKPVVMTIPKAVNKR